MVDSGSNPEMIRRFRPEGERGLGVFAILAALWQRRSLVWEMTRRELTDLHAGQAAGAVWLMVHPLLQFVIYTFLFTVVFQIRVSGKGPSDYLVYLFSGLAPWLLTQDVLMRTPNVFIANQSIVKKVMFPLEILVSKTLFSSLAVQCVLLVCALVFIFISRGFSATYLLLPALVVFHLSLIWGLALFFASITPYFRDVSEFVRIFVAINIYLIPVLYLPEMVPGALNFLLYLNPFSHLVWCYQDVLYFNSITHPWSWMIMTIISIGSLILGSYTFTRLRHYFASVL